MFNNQAVGIKHRLFIFCIVQCVWVPIPVRRNENNRKNISQFSISSRVKAQVGKYEKIPFNLRCMCMPVSESYIE
jgi:hypothetical protein